MCGKVLSRKTAVEWDKDAGKVAGFYSLDGTFIEDKQARPSGAKEFFVHGQLLASPSAYQILKHLLDECIGADATALSTSVIDHSAGIAPS